MPIDLSTIDFITDNANTSQEHLVGGKPRNFYPVSVGKFAVFQDLAGRIAAATRELLYDPGVEAGSQTETNSQEKLGSLTKQMTALPLTPALSQLHRDYRVKSITELFGTLDRKTLANLGLIILDSMRDDFPRDPKAPFVHADGDKLVDAMPVGMFVECVIAACTVSFDSFGPAVKKFIGGLLQRMQTTSAK